MAENLNYKKYEVLFVFINPHPSPLAFRLQEKGYKCYHIHYKGKRHLPRAILKLITLFIGHKPHIVHAHLFDASLAALIAAAACRIKKRIHTRHHSTFHHQYHKRAVKYDRIINTLSTHIIATTQTVANVLLNRENVNPEKVFIVHHGFNLRAFAQVKPEHAALLYKKYNPAAKHPVVGVMSRFTEWKGIQYIIPAFKKLLDNYPSALLILANAKGEYTDEIEAMLNTLPPGSYLKIPFEADAAALFKMFDVFVHVPLDNHSEAFGQVYVEALAAERPCIFTLSGIANDFIEDDVNAVVVPYKDAGSIYSALIKILENPVHAMHLSANGSRVVSQLFDITNMITRLEKIYES